MPKRTQRQAQTKAEAADRGPPSCQYCGGLKKKKNGGAGIYRECHIQYTQGVTKAHTRSNPLIGALASA
jgi:hypothetical protein